jgi:hypothetical protein
VAVGSIEETIRRHATRPQASEFGPGELRDWYRPRDMLATVRERVIPETSTPSQTLAIILADAGLPASEDLAAR